MKIIAVEVKRYKSLFDLNISNFKEVNFIFGLNNSGKSNFLSLISLIFRRKVIANEVVYVEDNIPKRRREIQEITPFWRGEIYDVPYLFFNDDRSSPIEFKIDIELKLDEIPNNQTLIDNGYLNEELSVILEINGKITAMNQLDSKFSLVNVKLGGNKIYSDNDGNPIFFEEPRSSRLNGNEDEFNTLINVLNDCTNFIDSDRFFKSEKFPTSVSGSKLTSSEKFKSWLFGLSLEADTFDKYKDLLDFLSDFKIPENLSKTTLKDNIKSFPFQNTKLSYSKYKDEIEIMLENGLNRFPLRNFGTGIQQIFYILSRIFDSNLESRILIIEELELNLSNEYLDILVDNLNKLIGDGLIDQVFTTSHSDNLYRSENTIFQAEIDSNGYTKMHLSNFDKETQNFKRSMMPHIQQSEKEQRRREGLS